MLWMLLIAGTGAGLAYAVSKKPDTFTITRSALLAVQPEALFAQVDDFRAWRAWSPWEGLDPALQRSYDGPAAGVGARYAWSGNGKAGAGSMMIRESVPASRIVLDLVFTRPMPAHNSTEFRFEPAQGGTRVTWTMTGQNNLMGKLFAVFVDVDKMVGKSFEQGLAKLGEVASAGKAP
jgi:Polyketide cyclase / dehydrase and lipid transport